MKEIVRQIIQEEDQLRQRVEKAQEEAASFLQRAHIQAQAMIDNTVAEVKSAGAQKSEELQQGFLKEKEKIISDTRKEAAELRRKRTADIPQLAQKLFTRIIEIR
jgi:vacuolar-type H+-ATPase subunit H